MSSSMECMGETSETQPTMGLGLTCTKDLRERKKKKVARSQRSGSARERKDRERGREGGREK